ncbi:MAG: phosphatase PAP2 family protein [Thiohalocapsa sp.]|nr:phosphatase PAP2 family protein [Thiohalocapsa sp.]MCF7990194.1 phosphatase PAP2 family protein [Thiohalocapsa sp.]
MAKHAGRRAGQNLHLLGIPVIALILFFAFADLMLAFPRIDLVVSGLFYSAEEGFAAQGTHWEQFAYRSVPVLMVGVNLGLVGLWLYNRINRRQLLGFDGRKLAFLLCLLALVPGLLVNQVFKEHWGRARPVKLEQFGGNDRFTPAFVRSDQGGGSFSSGHAAAAAYLVGVAAVLFGPRSRWAVAAALFTALVAVARVAAGGHFLSDVLASAFFVLFGYYFLFRLFFGRR